MPSLEQVLAPVRQVAPNDRAFSARMLLRLERRLASCAAALHPAVRPKGSDETLDMQDRVLATWLAAYYCGVSATPEVLRGDLLEPLIARSGCAEPFCGPADGGGADDDGSRLRFGLPSKPEARCDTRSELLRAAAAAIVALHAYLNYPRKKEAGPPADETVVGLTTLVIKSAAPPPLPPPSLASAASSDAGAEQQEQQQQQKEQQERIETLDAGLADLGLLPSCRALLASAGVRLRRPEGEGEEQEQEQGRAGGGGKDEGAKTAAADAADAVDEAAEAADAAAAEAADAARASADDPSSSSSSLPGVPGLASGSSAASFQQLEALPPLRTAHVRWLMHWARGRVLATMADVALFLSEDGDDDDARTRRAPQLLAAAQRDALGMASALPAHPAGYSLFAALAMRGQQFQAAVPFLRRGLAVARACRDDAAAARMTHQLAAALLLGGAGPSPADKTRLQPVALADVLALCDAGDSASASCAAWWPAGGGGFGPCPGDGEPERSVVWAKLLPAVAAREGVAGAAAAFAPSSGGGAGEEGGGGEEAEAAAAALARFLAETESIAPLEGLAWVSPPPRSVPPGAVVVNDGEEEEVGVVVEEAEEDKEAAAAAEKKKKSDAAPKKI